MGLPALLVLSVLAGAFISFGTIFATTVSAGSTDLPYGVGRLLFGLVFCAGLIMVVIARTELFTGNNFGRQSDDPRGAAQLQYTFGGGSVGLAALNIASAKTSLAFIPALTLGIMCNALVCVAIWMCFSAQAGSTLARFGMGDRRGFLVLRYWKKRVLYKPERKSHRLGG
jgi:formate transporter